jgi:SsrA-binding protein
MSKPFITNSKAHFNYEILDTFEAGLVLLGSEVKSLRAGHASLLEAFIILQDGELFLTKCYIKRYQGKNTGPASDEYRKRKLLVKKSEITDFIKKKREAGLTLIPLSVYDKHGKLKLSFALARGKKLHDKRETIKRRDANREMHRAMKERI